MSGDIEQAIDRLAYAVREESDRKIVFLTGSGISLPQVPSTEEMVAYFTGELGPSGAALAARVVGLSPTEQYQMASHELKQRRGDRGLAAAIRKGVLQALKSNTVDGVLEAGSIQAEDWNIPPAQRLLGELLSKIPPQQLGAIITTNFDSLTEVACGLHNVNAVSLAVPGSAAFPIEGVFGALPVVHLHGFWAKTATLSTAAQLQTERPQIERMISRLLDNSVLVVIGYGGWNDSFTRSLTQMVRDGRLSSLENEILWLQHGGPETVAAHPILKSIDGSAGVNTYFGVDASQFLAGVLDAIKPVRRQRRETFLGWATPPEYDELNSGREELLNYVQGAQPGWGTAGRMPMLENTKTALEAVKEELEANNPRVMILAAPAGEGKSTAIRQLALRCGQDFPDAAILYRNPGAPRISPEWIGYLKAQHEISIIFVDDGDLVTEQIIRAREKTLNSADGKILWVIAMHSTYLHSAPIRRQLMSVDPLIVEFQGFKWEDSEALASVWLDSNILPAEHMERSKTDVAQMIEDAALSTQGRSLFGSILHLWNGEGLVDRVSDLLSKVGLLSISGVSFKHLLSAVAVTQYAWDLEGDLGEGLSLSALGEMAHITHHDVLRMVVDPLGREVGISQVGDRVYVRHPSIAEAIYDLLEERGELAEVARDISRTGSTMRYSGAYTSFECKSAYRLARSLKGSAAIAASFGAIEGAGNRLEPRVTALATLRDNDSIEKASKYAQGLSQNLSVYADRLQVVRGFYVEWSVVESRLGHLERAIELAIRSISDQVDGFLPVDKLQYGLVNVLGPASKLEIVKRPGAAELRRVSTFILNRLPDPSGKFREQVTTEDAWSLLALNREFRSAALKFVAPGYTFAKMQTVLSQNDRKDRIR
jgi:hypothetical protein